MVYVDVRIESPTQTAHLSRRCSTFGRRWPCERTSRSTYARISFTSELTGSRHADDEVDGIPACHHANQRLGAKSKNARRRCGSSLPFLRCCQPGEQIISASGPSASALCCCPN